MKALSMKIKNNIECNMRYIKRKWYSTEFRENRGDQQKYTLNYSNDIFEWKFFSPIVIHEIKRENFGWKEQT
jgi:hypothetical protein